MRHQVAVFAASVLLTVASIARAETITVPAEVPFAEGLDVTNAVRTECTLQTRLPQFIVDGAGRGLDVVIGDTAAATSGKVLQLEFTNILGFGGGAWSGPKSVTVTGKLYENGQLIGNFVASRYSTGGAFAGFKGTCSILGRCIETLGVDIARWLAKPTMDARLGNA
jgi:hypothetical protein